MEKFLKLVKTIGKRAVRAANKAVKKEFCSCGAKKDQKRSDCRDCGKSLI